MESYTEKELLKKKKDELVYLCKERNLPISGIKAVLIGRILGQPPLSNAPRSTTKKKAKTGFTTLTGHPTSWSGIIKPKYIHARKNAHGNYEDPVTHFVFDYETCYVLGKQVGEAVIPLGIEDIKICREKGLDFNADVFDGNLTSKEEDIETTIERLITTEQDDEDDEETEDDAEN